MKNQIYSLLVISMIITACSKEEELPVSPDQNSILFPLEVGSYWIYEFKTIQEGGNILGTKMDTLKITGKDSSNGHSYYTLSTSIIGEVTMYWRDSSGYIVDQYGNVVLTPKTSSMQFNRKTHYITDERPAYEIWHEFPEHVNYEYQSRNYLSILNKQFHILLLDGSNDEVIDEFIYSEIGPMQRSYTYALSKTKLLGNLIDHHLE